LCIKYAKLLHQFITTRPTFDVQNVVDVFFRFCFWRIFITYHVLHRINTRTKNYFPCGARSTVGRVLCFVFVIYRRVTQTTVRQVPFPVVYFNQVIRNVCFRYAQRDRLQILLLINLCGCIISVWVHFNSIPSICNVERLVVFRVWKNAERSIYIRHRHVAYQTSVSRSYLLTHDYVT